jgi:hypothetical protein
MSRTLFIIILGAITAVALSALGAVLLFSLRYFQISDVTTVTIVPTVEVITATTTLEPTSTVTVRERQRLQPCHGRSHRQQHPPADKHRQRWGRYQRRLQQRRHLHRRRYHPG